MVKMLLMLCLFPQRPQGQLLMSGFPCWVPISSLHFPMAPKEMENRPLVMGTSLLSSHDPTPFPFMASWESQGI